MGQKTKAIIKLDIKKLVKDLNSALADEWLAYYQYWIGSRIVVGPLSKEVQKELEEHAQEELKHANMLTDRIIQLDGIPILNPKSWNQLTNCGYLEPKNFKEAPILKQNLEGERCAIVFYNNLLEELRGKDHITFHIIHDILKDEIQHECDLEILLNNLK